MSQLALGLSPNLQNALAFIRGSYMLPASMEVPVAKQERSFLDTAADKMRVPERVESDNVLKWDGKRLYVTERTYRGEHRSGERKRDVSREIATHLASLTKDGGS